MEVYCITLEDKTKIIAHERAWAKDNGMRCKVYETGEGFGIEKRGPGGYCSWMEFEIDSETDSEIKEIIEE